MNQDELRTGCVIRFPYLWVREAERGETEGRKHRPVAVGVRIARPKGEDLLVLFPITSQPPSSDRFAAEIPEIGIGGSLAAPPLPHHRTYGSVSGGSADYADRGAATEAKPSELKKLFGRAMVSAGLFASRQGPCGFPAVCAARFRPTPRRRSSTKRAGPYFHCFQAMARNRRLSHSSSLRNTDGVWQKPK